MSSPSSVKIHSEFTPFLVVFRSLGNVSKNYLKKTFHGVQENRQLVMGLSLL